MGDGLVALQSSRLRPKRESPAGIRTQRTRLPKPSQSVTAVVAFAPNAYRELVDGFDGTPLETVAFGFAGRFGGSDRWGLIIDKIELVPTDGYRERSHGHFR